MSEQKKINQHMIKIASVTLAALLSCGGIAVLAKNAAAKNDDTNTASGSDSSVSETADNKNITKDETVYVLANADGSVKKVIVSDWIKNSLDAAKLTDKTDLKDVKNVKGDESYTMDADNMKVWDAEGNDIYYQGTIDKELPVDLSVKYTLDGKSVSPAELAGKSGKVTMRFDYTNKQYETVDIDGKQTKIYVPFIMLTGMILDNDNFKNIDVTNGKLINDGDHTVVAGFALPGMQDNLNIDKDKLEIPDYVEISAEVTDFTLSTTMTVATNSLFNDIDLSKIDGIDDLKDKMNTLTDAMKQLTDGSSQLYNGLSTLLGKSKQLVEAINTLSSGAAKVNDGAQSLNAGLKLLVSNNADLNAGAATVFNTLLTTVQTQVKNNGITIETLTIENYKTVLNGLLTTPNATQQGQLVTIADTTLNTKLTEKNVPENYYNAVKFMLYERIAAGMTQDAAMAEIEGILTDAVFAAGVNAAQPDAAIVGTLTQRGVEQNTAEAISKICVYLASVKGGSPADYVTTATAIAPTLTAKGENAKKVQAAAAKAETPQGKTAIAGLCLGLAQQTLNPTLQSAIAQLDSYNQFYQGLIKYTAGVQTAYEGSNTLADGTKQVANGAAELNGQASALPDGVKQLTDGSMQLSDGIKQLNEQGIQKLVDLMNGDAGSLVTRLKATVDVSKDYKSFGGICDGQDGSVKFIYKTDSIEK